MSQDYARPLYTNELANQFLTKVLGYKKDGTTSELATQIMKAEVLLSTMARCPTLYRSDYRNPSYSSDEARIQLREQIFTELISQDRLANDDDTRLTFGGIKPPGTNSKQERQAYILIGPPASGKSGISNNLADTYGAHIIDSDFAKRKFPEFHQEYGASLVHEESIVVTFGLDEPEFREENNVLGYCIAHGHNLVIPKIGSGEKSIRDLKELLKRFSYDVHLTLVKVNRLIATQRATERFQSSKRYVPLSLVFDGYGNDPIITYHTLKNEPDWASFGAVSTEGIKPVALECSGSNPASLY